MSSLEERREQFKRYKRDVQARGKPFHPYAMFHDTVMSLVVVTTIVVLTIVWKFTAGETPSDPEAIPEAGWLGKIYDEEADSGTTSFIPRPDWYYYFLFYLLRVFKWPDSVVLGTVGIPTIALILLFALPFVDRRIERRLLRRPVAMVAAVLVVLSMGVLTYKGAVAREFLASEVKELVPKWIAQQDLRTRAAQVPGAGPSAAQLAEEGAELFGESGCLNCHTYLGTGASALGAPDLSAEGARNRGLKFQIDHLRNPQSTTPGSPMPPFAQLGEENLRKIAIFLEASKGPR